MPMPRSSFKRGCHDGSVVSIAELLVLEALETDVLEWLICVGEATLGRLGGMMDCAGGGGFECRCPNKPPRRP